MRQVIKDVIADAKANPRKLNYGSSGNGTTSHLGGAMFASMSGIEMTHVPRGTQNASRPDDAVSPTGGSEPSFGAFWKS